MKFAQLIRPLFLVALGLHGLVLFLPVGEDAETAEVEVAEETVLAERSPAPEQLPVPDLNVAADGTALVPTSGLFSPVSPPVVAGQPASSTLAARPGSTTRSVPAAASVPSAAAARSAPEGERPSTSTSEPASSSPVTSSDVAVDSSNGLTPSSNVQPSVDESLEERSQPTNSTEPSTPESTQLSQSLIASARDIRQLPDALKALMNRWANALAYDSEGTGDRSARKAQTKWTEKINAQASGAGVGHIEAESVENFARIRYPIEASVQNGKETLPETPEQSFLVCLEQSPSPAEVGVLFDSQGEIVGKPKLIRSSGYKAINAEAIATVAAAEAFPEDRLSKAFIFEVEVDYDPRSCVKLSELKED